MAQQRKAALNKKSQYKATRERLVRDDAKGYEYLGPTGLSARYTQRLQRIVSFLVMAYSFRLGIICTTYYPKWSYSGASEYIKIYRSFFLFLCACALYTCICTYIHICIYVNVHACICICVHMRTRIHIYIYTCIQVCIYMCVQVYTYIPTCMRVYLYIYMQGTL